MGQPGNGEKPMRPRKLPPPPSADPSSSPWLRLPIAVSGRVRRGKQEGRKTHGGQFLGSHRGVGSKQREVEGWHRVG